MVPAIRVSMRALEGAGPGRDEVAVSAADFASLEAAVRHEFETRFFGAWPLAHMTELVLLDAEGVVLDSSFVKDIGACRQPVLAFEVFSRTPCDLFRTVKPTQLVPFVDAANPTAFSAVSPLFCAAFSATERPAPPSGPWAWFDTQHIVLGASHFQLTGPHGVFHAVGIAAGAPALPGRPLTDVAEGESFCSLDQLAGSHYPVRLTPGQPVPDWVKVDDFPANEIAKGAQVCALAHPTDRKKNKSAGAKLTRRGFFCYKLAAGTDLAPHGLAAVFDNMVEGHFSLIPFSTPFPRRADLCSNFSVTGAGKVVLGLEGAALVVDGFIHVPIDGCKNAFCCPRLAAQYTVHCFKMVASADPPALPLPDDADDTTVVAAAVDWALAGPPLAACDTAALELGFGGALVGLAPAQLHALAHALNAALAVRDECGDGVDDLLRAAREIVESALCLTMSS